MKIRVIYIVPPSNQFAGVERVVHDVALGLCDKFNDIIDVTVLYCSRYDELQVPLPYHVVWADVDRLRNFPFRVAQILKQETYDVVVAAQYEATALLWLVHRLQGGKARFAMHLHGNPKIERSVSLRARFAFIWFEALLVRMNRILAVSPSLAKYLAERVGSQVPVQYLPNPVRQFSNVRRTEKAESPVSFVSVGRLAWQKGHDVLLEALAKILAQGVDAELTIVGAGPSERILARQIDRLGIADRVRLAGHISDPAQLLAAADCFISASRWEGFGLAIVEAMSAGLYVIATDCEFGPRDLIDCPEKGRIVANSNVDALASAMIEFANSKESRRGNDPYDQVRRDAAIKFSLANVVAQHAAMLTDVANGSAKKY